MGFPLTTCFSYREISARFLIWIKAAVPKSDIVLRSFSGADPDPIASMQAIKNPELHAVTGQVRDLPKKAVEAI
jgi:hypothetical protein